MSASSEMDADGVRDRRARIERHALDRLTRHQTHRENGLPTVSVLTGPAAAAEGTWESWLAGRQMVPARCEAPELGALARAWLAAVVGARDLVADAVHHYLPDVDPDARARVLRRHLPERQAWLEQLGAAGAPAPVIAALARELARPDGSRTDDGLADDLATAAAIATFLPAHTLPGVLLVAPPARPDSDGRPAIDAADAADAGWLAGAAEAAAAWASHMVAVPIAIACSSGAVSAFLRSGASRAHAFVREGLVTLPGPAGPADAPADAATAARSYAASLGSSERLLALLEDALRAHSDALRLDPARGQHAGRAAAAEPMRAGGDEPAREDSDEPAREDSGERSDEPLERPILARADEQARSAAERLLYEALARHPVTAGLFGLNQRIGFRFGSAALEVDLVATSLALAIEVDGYYHFRDAAAYRRDRRKDILLQQHGFWVARFLADDVVMELDRVVETIAALVAHRSAAGAPGTPPEDSGATP